MEITEDHDVLIGLRSEIIGLRQVVETHNIASVERDTRIEEGLKMVNGTVRRHNDELLLHANVPHSGVDKTTSTELSNQVSEMWMAWGIGKWVGSGAVLALLGQTAALLTVIIRGL